MAQQTQVQRVVPFYRAWLKRFPTMTSLARSSKPAVLAQWSGLGYNNRALRLHRLAKEVVENRDANLPRGVEELERLPGIGRYTAHAVACFAFGQDVPVVDVNIRRIFSRVFWKVRSATDLRSEKEIWKLAESYLPAHHVSEWNQALMDLGALICTARNPRCGSCPIKINCASAFSGNFEIEGRSRRNHEPSFKGIPRRIYRGKILKALHQRPMTIRQLGMTVVSQFHPRDTKWMKEVLEKMELDELVSIQGSGSGKLIRIAQ